MKYIIFYYLFIFVGFSGFAQEIVSDSIPQLRMMNNRIIEDKHFSIRVGAGFQKSLYTELGVALHTQRFGCTGFFSKDFYTALEWTPNKLDDVYGLKVGFEANAMLINVALEVKYQTDFKQNDFVITPKVGLGVFGEINLFYGYNISTNSSPFHAVGQHQFSLVINIHRYFMDN